MRELLLLGFIFMVGCQSKMDEGKIPFKEISYFNDCESFTGWNHDANLYHEKAYSGFYCSKTDIAAPYGIAFKKKISDITQLPFRKIKTSCMAFRSASDCNVQMVLSIEKNGKSIYWNGAPIKNYVSNANVWGKVEVDFILPDSIRPDKDDEVLYYMWNTGNCMALGDDFKITFAY